MKSLLVMDSVSTTVTDPSKLARGEGALVDQNGSIIGAEDTLGANDMVQFVVGLGNGKFKEGVTLSKVTAKAYEQATGSAYTPKVNFTAISLDMNNEFEDTAALSITLPPKGVVGDRAYLKEAYVTITDKTDVSGALVRWKNEIDKAVTEINEFYGKTIITITPAVGTPLATSATLLTIASTLPFNANMEGAIKATKAVPDPGLKVLTTTELLQMEKDLAVPSIAYNKEVEDLDSEYGDIFTTDLTKTYVSYSVTSKSPETNDGTGGMLVTQLLAIPASVSANLETIIGKLATIV